MEHPFDARKVMLTDLHQPHSVWRPVSLISALREAMLQGGGPYSVEGGQRVPSLRPIIDELTSRGFDGDTLVRYGLGPEIFVTIILSLFSRRFPAYSVRSSTDLPDPEQDSVPRESLVDSETWDRVVTLTIEELHGPVDWSKPTSTNVVILATSGMSKILPWILSAPLDSILGMDAPTAEQLIGDRGVMPPEPVILEEYRWIIERFSITRLSDWATPSLHLEHQWLTGDHPAPCDEKLMRDRLVNRRELNDEIARRAASGLPTSPSRQLAGIAGMGNALTKKMQQRAVELLQIKRFREAATLFEFAVGEDPNDASAVNNLGFCLTPENPHEALTFLQRAYRLGYAPSSINVYNRALCHFLIGQHRVALNLIKDEWSKTEDCSSVLWVIGESGLELKTGASCRLQLACLATSAAHSISDDVSASHWTKVMTELDRTRKD